MVNFDRNKRSGGLPAGRQGFSRGGFRGRDSSDRQMFQATCDKCKRDCEVPFRPTQGKPIFCSNCFDRNTDPRGGGERSFNRPSFEDKRMYDAVCDECGNSCKVPFQPRGDKPIYCSNCFGSKDNGGSRNMPPAQNNSQQFNELNAKLDAILKILSPKPPKEAKVEETITVSGEELVEKPVKLEEIKEEKVKAPKKKAISKKKLSAVV